MALVRVVIPTYNRRHFVMDAVQSALSQTLSDVEVIVVDDGSTDGTSGIFEALADPRVTYIQQQNGGVASARNLAIRQPACPPYIAFLDSDDVWIPGHLEESLAAMNREGVALACSRKRVQDLVGVHTAEGAIGIHDAESAALEFVRTFKGGGVADVRRSIYLGRYAPVTSTVVVRSDATDRWFDPSFRVLEDLELFARLPQPFAILDSIHVLYRQVGNNLTGERRLASPEMLKNQLSVFEFYRLARLHAPGAEARGRYARQAYFVGQCYQAQGSGSMAREYYWRAIRGGSPWPAVKSYLSSFVSRWRAMGKSR